MAQAGTFEDLGVPVTKAMLMATAVGPDATGKKDLLYFDFAQTGATLLLVVVDPDTGEAKQYKSPIGAGAWALIRGPDDCMYLGTWDGGYILKFDPKQAGKGIQVVGKPSQTETYIWQYAVGKDGKLYGCTYGQAKLISYDPKTGKMEDLGRMDETQMYTRSIACGPNGKIYTGVGFGKANVVVYDPATRQHKSILPEPYRKETVASVHQGADGNVYARCGNQTFRIDDETMVPIPADKVVSPQGLVLRDGRTVTVGEVTASSVTFTVAAPSRERQRVITFNYQGDGSIVFVVGVGPENKVYGSTAMPLEMFVYDPTTQQSKHLGNPTVVNGEIYSFVTLRDKLYVCAYPGSYLSVYDPKKPFKFGTNPGDNPRGYGYVGDGHLRPRAMILGPDEKIYIGSLPPYGQLGGAMGVFDPVAEKVVENYRNLIPNQSIVALAYEPQSGLVFGGSSIAGGGGAVPSEKEAYFFAWDSKAKKKVIDFVPVAGDTAIVAMAAAVGKIFAVSRPSNTLFVYDPAQQKIVHTAKIEFGAVHDISLGLHKSGLLYGLAGNAVFTVDPRTYAVNKVAEYAGGITCGFALTDDAIYFGSGARLVRWRM